MKFLSVFAAISTATSVQAQYYDNTFRNAYTGQTAYLRSGYCTNMGYQYFSGEFTGYGHYGYIWTNSDRCQGSATYVFPYGNREFNYPLQIGSAAFLKY